MDPGTLGRSAAARALPGRAAAPDRHHSRSAGHRAGGPRDRPARVAEPAADGVQGRQRPPRPPPRRSGEHVDRPGRPASRGARGGIEVPHPRLRRAGGEAARDRLSRGRLALAWRRRVLLLPLRLAPERGDHRPPLLPRARGPLPPHAAGDPSRGRARPFPRRARGAVRADVRRHGARRYGAAAAGDLGRGPVDRHPLPRRDAEPGHFHGAEMPQEGKLLPLASRSVLAGHAVHVPRHLRHAPRPRRAPDRRRRQGPSVPPRRSGGLGTTRLVGPRPAPPVRGVSCRVARAPGAGAGAPRPAAGGPGPDRRLAQPCRSLCRRQLCPDRSALGARHQPSRAAGGPVRAPLGRTPGLGAAPLRAGRHHGPWPVAHRGGVRP